MVTKPPCADVRESLSAVLDGEEPSLPGGQVDDHLAGCSACARYAASLDLVTRRVRVGAAADVPDLTAPILQALGTAPAAGGDGRFRQLRGLVAMAGLAQLMLALPAMLGLVGPDLHLGRELGSLQLALGVGLLVAAWQPHRTPGVLPIAAVVAVAVVVTAVADVATGQVTLLAELGHLAEVVGVAALWGLSRRLPDDPGRAVSPVPVAGL